MKSIKLKTILLATCAVSNTALSHIGSHRGSPGSTPIPPTPDDDILDAILLEGGGAMLAENGNYLKLESSN